MSINCSHCIIVKIYDLHLKPKGRIINKSLKNSEKLKTLENGVVMRF